MSTPKDAPYKLAQRHGRELLRQPTLTSFQVRVFCRTTAGKLRRKGYGMTKLDYLQLTKLVDFEAKTYRSLSPAEVEARSGLPVAPPKPKVTEKLA